MIQQGTTPCLCLTLSVTHAIPHPHSKTHGCNCTRSRCNAQVPGAQLGKKGSTLPFVGGSCLNSISGFCITCFLMATANVQMSDCIGPEVMLFSLWNRLQFACMRPSWCECKITPVCRRQSMFDACIRDPG